MNIRHLGMAAVIAAMGLSLGGCKKDAPKVSDAELARQQNAAQFSQVQSQLSEISGKLDNMPAQPASPSSIDGFGPAVVEPTPNRKPRNLTDYSMDVPTRPIKTRPTSTRSSSKFVVVSGVTVQQVQRALASAGFNPGKADGVAGPKTVSALKQFQSAEGLKADGVVGSRTWERLRKHAR